MFDALLEKVMAVVLPIYRRLNDLSGGLLDILVCTFERFSEGRAHQAAASMAYYFIFALFPLLLLVVSLGSSVLENHDVQQIVADWVAETIPGSEELLLGTIEAVLSTRGPMTIVGVVSLLWSASGAFTALSYNVDLIWPGTESSDIIRLRLAGVAIVALLFGMIIVSTIAGTVVDTIIHAWQSQGLTKTADVGSRAWQIGANASPWLFRFLPFYVLFRWIPNKHVRIKAALIGALFTTLVWELVTRLFVWFLKIGWIDYSVIYGSLGAMMALLFWMYLYSSVIFIGAALASSVDQPPNQPFSRRAVTS